MGIGERESTVANMIVSGTGFETESERRTAELLEGLPASWTIVANKFLAVGHGKSFEIDFIVVADHRIIVLDDKYWKGPITGSDEWWTLHSTGEVRKSPFNQVERNARNVKAFLEKRNIAIPYKREQPIIGSIIVTYPGVIPQIRDPRAAHCLLTRDNALKKLLWLDDECARAGLDVSRHRSLIVRALDDHDERHRSKVPKSISFFRIEEKLDERDGCHIFTGVHEDDNSRRTLYVYEQLEPWKEEHLDRELSALRKLQNSGIVPIIESSFPWGEHGHKVVPVRPPSGCAWGALPLPKSEAAAIRQLEIVAAAFEALEHIHAAGIVHRAINPSNLIVSYDGLERAAEEAPQSPPHVAFTDFVSARIDGNRTIVEQLDKQGFRDLYAAPEINRMGSYAFAERSSDVYSLALVTLERVMGLNAIQIVEALASNQDLPHHPTLWPYLTEDELPQLSSLYRSALSAGSFDGSKRITALEFAVGLKGIISQLSARRNAAGSDDSGSNRYEVKKLLGEGAFARTYLVLDTYTSELFAAKQYRRKEILEEKSQILKEFEVLWKHPHPNLPRPYSAPDPNNRAFQFLMEYIPGETLREKLPEFKHNRDQWANVMRGLLAAVEHLERHGVLHRDIKPDNVMIRDSDGVPILIDHGSAVSSDQKASLAGAPSYWPPEWRTGLELPASADRYAAAVTLFETLTGSMPFSEDATAFSRELKTELPSDIPAELHGVCQVLLRALADDPTERYQTAPDLRRALENALNKSPQAEANADTVCQFNDWVSSLRGLFRSSRRGNSDNRGLDTQFARQTYVETALDTRLWPAVQKSLPAMVLLSGNPGDGKTAFLERIRENLLASSASTELSSDASGWEISRDGHTFRACFDASESANQLSATEQLQHRLRGLEGEAPSPGITVLIAINDGRLAEIQRELAMSHPWMTTILNGAGSILQAGELETSPIWLIDLKKRSYVSLNPESNAPSVMRQMLDAMVDASHWPGDKDLATAFPPAANAISLRVAGPDSPAHRLEYLLALSHLRGDRHTTVRDLRSALAFLITGDLDFQEYGQPDPEHSAYPWTHKYWNLAFTTEDTRDLVLGDLRWLDPARFAHPELERFLYFHHYPEHAPLRSKLFVNNIDEPAPAGDDPHMLRDWIAAVKRRLFFEGARFADHAPVSLDPLSLVPYGSALQMIDLLAGKSDGAELLGSLLRGIGRSDGIDVARYTTDLVLRVMSSEDPHIEIVKTFPRDDFELFADESVNHDHVETTPRTLRLRHPKSEATLQLNLDLVETLVRLANGLEPRTMEIQPLLEELAPFKGRLQRSLSPQLLIIEGGRRHHVLKEGERLFRRDA